MKLAAGTKKKNKEKKSAVKRNMQEQSPNSLMKLHPTISKHRSSTGVSIRATLALAGRAEPAPRNNEPNTYNVSQQMLAKYAQLTPLLVEATAKFTMSSPLISS